MVATSNSTTAKRRLTQRYRWLEAVWKRAGGEHNPGINSKDEHGLCVFHEEQVMAFSLTWLPRVLLDAGLKVAEQPGWQNRAAATSGRRKG
jgi:hypothetical protein